MNQTSATSTDLAANEQSETLLSGPTTTTTGGKDSRKGKSLYSSPPVGTKSSHFNPNQKIVLKEDHFGMRQSHQEDTSVESKGNLSDSSDSKQRRKNKLNEMFILRSLKVSIKRENFKKDRRNSKEVKSQLRIERKDPAERRRQACVNFLHTVIERPVRFICKLTIPTSEKEKWHRGFASCNPTGGFFLLMIASDRKSSQ